MAAAADSTSVQVDTAHDDMIHDAQLDYYGKRLATCSSDRTVKIFDVGADGEYTLIDTLRGHEGPVWQVSWAHPKFGSILASCSYDGKVFVWREGEGHSPGWQRIKEHTLHNASVNSISWAPHELGSVLACASSDGKVSVLTFNNDGTWEASLFPAHTIGCNAVSWAPATKPGALIESQPPIAHPPHQSQDIGVIGVKRFASGGCDGLVKIWGWKNDTKEWKEEEVLDGHTDWVRDVAWAPNIGLPRSYIASAGQDKAVHIWMQDAPRTTTWTKSTLDGSVLQQAATAASTQPGATAAPSTGTKFADTVWRVSWSPTGQILAVSSADGKVTLWKENLKGVWDCANELE